MRTVPSEHRSLNCRAKLGAFDHDDGIGAVGHWGAGHDARDCAWRDGARGDGAGDDFFQDDQFGAAIFQIGAADGVAIDD